MIMQVKLRTSLLSQVEEILRAANVPYINVDEAKKAHFAGAKLKAFHFVMYQPEGLNWLIWCGNPSSTTRADMKQWGEIFGAEFIVVYAMRRKSGIVFRGPGGVYMQMGKPLGKVDPVYHPFRPDIFDKTTGAQTSLLGERYEGSTIGSRTASMFGDMRPDPRERVQRDDETMDLFGMGELQ